jgi:hypothetical protein
VLGGGEQSSCLDSSGGYSSKAHCTGNRSYLEPISGSMQKPIEGLIAIGAFSGQWHVGNARRIYLERIRNSLQKPVEGGVVFSENQLLFP